MGFIFFLLFINLLGCSDFSKQNNKKLNHIDKSNIKLIEIKKNLYDEVSVKLSDKEIEKFVNIINDTKNAELLKAGPRFWIFIEFNDGRLKLYKLLDSYIGEGDLYIKTNEANYFQKIYLTRQKYRHSIRINQL